MSTVSAPQPADRAAAECYADLFWADRAGWVVGGIGADGHFIGSSYRYERFRQVSCQWPRQREQFLDRMMAAAPDDDVFIAVLLRSAPTRDAKRSSALPGEYAWMDVDEPWDDGRHRQLVLTGHKVLTVSSGGVRGGEHVYVHLGGLRPTIEIQRYCEGLQDRFGTDSWGGLNKLLRLPGTFNHKGRALGGASAAVTWH